MCTAMTFQSKDRYFGRTLDYEQAFGEAVVITPRHFGAEPRYAMVGMATVAEGIPLYYDAMNENGLCMAGLLFPPAVYLPPHPQKKNLPPHALISYLLGRCADLREVEVLLEKIRLTAGDFSPQYRCAPLHWMLADRTRAAVLEATGELHLYEAAAGVLTNAPAFPQQEEHRKRFQGLSPHSAAERGKEAVGLPGDWSSPSRYVRAAFVAEHSRCAPSEEESVAHFFRMLQSVAVPKGCLRVAGEDAYTRYTCCCNQHRGIYYFSTYEDPRIRAVELGEQNGSRLQIFSAGGLKTAE